MPAITSATDRGDKGRASSGRGSCRRIPHLPHPRGGDETSKGPRPAPPRRAGSRTGLNADTVPAAPPPRSAAPRSAPRSRGSPTSPRPPAASVAARGRAEPGRSRRAGGARRRPAGIAPGPSIVSYAAAPPQQAGRICSKLGDPQHPRRAQVGDRAEGHPDAQRDDPGRRCCGRAGCPGRPRPASWPRPGPAEAIEMRITVESSRPSSRPPELAAQDVGLGEPRRWCRSPVPATIPPTPKGL